MSMEDSQQQYEEEDFSQRLPLKNHINKLEMMLKQLEVDLEDSKKEKEQLRNDLVTLSQIDHDQNNEGDRFLLEESRRLLDELHESNELQSEQHLFLKQQTDSINMDRIKLQQNIIVLENKTEELEKEFGFV